MINKIIKLILIFEILIILIFLKNSIMYITIKNFLRNNSKRLIKKILLSKMFKKTKKNINRVNSLIIKGNSRFGNFFISINNAIIYCEILNCKKIIIENNNNIYINKIMYYKQNNFTIEPNQTFKYNDNYSIIINVNYFIFHGLRFFRNINRFNFFREQLLNNIPKVKVHPNSLYISIRSGDIFTLSNKASIKGYFQPPLCFYIKILNKFKFNKVYIISENNLNPVIPNLLKKYSYIKQIKNNFKVDISYLINSYNVVASKSTFFSVCIKLNNKLKSLWEYDFLTSKRKSYLDFHTFYKLNHYTIYKMNSSVNFRKIMIPWLNSHKQRKMMFKEKCKYNFDIIKE